MPTILRWTGSAWQQLRRVVGVSGQLQRWDTTPFTPLFVPVNSLRYWTGSAWSANLVVEFPSVAGAPSLFSVSQASFLSRVVDITVGSFTSDALWYVEAEVEYIDPFGSTFAFLVGLATGYAGGTQVSTSFDLATINNVPGNWQFRARYRYRDATDQSAFTPWASTTVTII